MDLIEAKPLNLIKKQQKLNLNPTCPDVLFSSPPSMKGNELLHVNNVTCYPGSSIFHSVTVPLLHLQILHTMQQKTSYFLTFCSSPTNRAEQIMTNEDFTEGRVAGCIQMHKKSHTTWFNICFEKKSESLTKAFQRIVFGIFWHFSPNKTPIDIFFFQKDTEPFQAFFFPLMRSFAISRQLLLRAYLNMYERLLNCHVHFRQEHVLKILNSRHGPAGKTINAINACASP